MSKQISKAKAEQVADAYLATTLGKKINEKSEEIKTTFLNYYYSEHLEDGLIEKLNGISKEYLNMEHYFYIRGEQEGSFWMSVDSDIYMRKNGICISQETYNKLRSLRKQKETIESEQRKICSQIIETIYSLRTIKKVEEHFPQVLPYFKHEDKTEVQLPAIQIKSILSEIELICKTK